MRTRNYFLAVVAFAMASFILFHFFMIVTYGKFYIFESNPLILFSEIILIVAIMIFSFYCLIDEILHIKKPASLIDKSGDFLNAKPITAVIEYSEREKIKRTVNN